MVPLSCHRVYENIDTSHAASNILWVTLWSRRQIIIDWANFCETQNFNEDVEGGWWGEDTVELIQLMDKGKTGRSWLASGTAPTHLPPTIPVVDGRSWRCVKRLQEVELENCQIDDWHWTDAQNLVKYEQLLQQRSSDAAIDAAMRAEWHQKTMSWCHFKNKSCDLYFKLSHRFTEDLNCFNSTLKSSSAVSLVRELCGWLCATQRRSKSETVE